MGDWYRLSIELIYPVMYECLEKGLSDDEFRRRLRSEYPFAWRRGWAYKEWLRACRDMTAEYKVRAGLSAAPGCTERCYEAHARRDVDAKDVVQRMTREVKAIQAQGFEEWCEANPEVTLPVHDLCEDCQHRFYEATVARDVRRLTALGYTVMIGKCVVEARGDRLVYRRVE